MLDNLRDQSANTPFFQEEIPDISPIDSFQTDLAIPESKPLLGMTAMQRFVIATMLFFVVCLMGAMFLMILGKISF